MSPGISWTILLACVVKRRTFSAPSRKTVAMSVALSRFFMSLFIRERSVTFAWSSAFTVWSSSFSDWSSSLEVVISSFVDCSSSFVDCSSSFVDFSSSWEVCISSRVDCSSWPARCSASSSSATCGLRPARPRAGIPAWAGAGAPWSEKTIITSPRSASGTPIAWTCTSTACSPPPVSTFRSLRTTGRRERTAFRNAAVRS